jgi:hypothetical protein
MGLYLDIYRVNRPEPTESEMMRNERPSRALRAFVIPAPPKPIEVKTEPSK